MQTNFSPEQLTNPDVAASEQILRTCVHCGFCTATCPTYQLLGDELDSPRGRIYLMKEMFEQDQPASKEVVTHIDRCLSCLSCMSTCPSGVNYMHLVDHGRKHIEETYKRPLHDRALRMVLAKLLPYPKRFRVALFGAWFARPLRFLLGGRLKAMLSLAPAKAPMGGLTKPGEYPAEGTEKKRVLLLAGCAQQVIAPEINAATIRLLNRLGVTVIVPKSAGCCGALTHHMGKTDASHQQAKANVSAWLAEHERQQVDAIIINTSGCGTTVKDYGFMLRNESEWADPGERVSTLAQDITEFLDANKDLLPKGQKQTLDITYHSACSMQHGQQIKTAPQSLLKRLGFRVKDVPLGHLCCGSAGTYNLLQPEIARQLRDAKVENIAVTKPDLIVAGNVGCITQIASGTETPMMHTAELMDWVTGGPRPPAVDGTRLNVTPVESS